MNQRHWLINNCLTTYKCTKSTKTSFEDFSYNSKLNLNFANGRSWLSEVTQNERGGGGNNEGDIYLTILFDVSWECWRCDCQAYSWWCLSLSPASMWVFCRRQGGYNSWDACLSTAIYSQLHQIIFSIFVPCSSSFFLLFSLSLNIWGGSPVAESTASKCNNLIRSRSYLPRTLFASRLFCVGTCNAIFLLAFLCLPIISRVEWTGVPPTSPEMKLLWISDADRTHTGSTDTRLPHLVTYNNFIYSKVIFGV